MNKNTEFNQALKASGEKSNNRDKTMSCEEDTSQVTKKRKSILLSTPRYVIMNTRDVKDLVQSRLYLVYSKYTDKMAVGIKDFITCIGGRTTQHHFFAFIFCHFRQLLKHVKSEKLREFLDFMVTTRLDFYTKKIVKKIYNTSNIKNDSIQRR